LERTCYPKYGNYSSGKDSADVNYHRSEPALGPTDAAAVPFKDFFAAVLVDSHPQNADAETPASFVSIVEGMTAFELPCRSDGAPSHKELPVPAPTEQRLRNARILDKAGTGKALAVETTCARVSLNSDFENNGSPEVAIDSPQGRTEATLQRPSRRGAG